MVNLLRYLLKKTDFNLDTISEACCSKHPNEQTDDSDAESQYLTLSTKYPFKQTYD